MKWTTSGVPGILEEVARQGAFMTVNLTAGPLSPMSHDMPLDQALIVQIERVGPREPVEESALAWLAANAVENDALPTDLADQHDCYLYGCPTKDRPL